MDERAARVRRATASMAGAADRRGDAAGAAEALEAVIDAVPGAVSLAPGSVAPALGGEPVDDAPLVAVGGRRSTAEATQSLRRAVLQAGPLAVAGLATNGANVIVTVLLARLLSTRGYGALNQLNGLFLVVSMPGSAVIVAVVRRVTGWAAAGSTTRIRQWGRRLHRQGSVALVVFAAAAVGAGPWLAGVLGQPHTVGLDAMLAAGSVWILLCLDRGLLQAHRSYRTLSANLLVEGGMRTAGVLVLVATGLGVSGAACGLLVAEVVTALHARLTADRAWTTAAGEPALPGRFRLGRTLVQAVAEPVGRARRGGALDGGAWAERRLLLVDLAAALVALAMAAWLQNVDVIVMGRDAPSASGAYAAVSVASKALVFGAVVLGGYLLPEAAIRWRQGGHALRELGATLLFLAVPAGILLVVAIGTPRLLLRVVFSARYLGAEAAFAPLVVAMICLSVTVMLTMYLLAVGDRRAAVLLVVGAAAVTVAVAAAHGSPVGTARADMVVQAAVMASVLVDFASLHRRRLR